jgi:hypothetical protein
MLAAATLEQGLAESRRPFVRWEETANNMACAMPLTAGIWGSLSRTTSLVNFDLFAFWLGNCIVVGLN